MAAETVAAAYKSVIHAVHYTVTREITRSSAIAGRPCDAKACQGLQKWTWK